MIDRKRLEKRLKMIPELTKIRRKLAAQNIAEKSGQIIQEQEALKNPIVQTQKEIVSKLEEQRKDVLDRETLEEEKRIALLKNPPPVLNKKRLEEIEAGTPLNQTQAFDPNTRDNLIDMASPTLSPNDFLKTDAEFKTLLSQKYKIVDQDILDKLMFIRSKTQKHAGNKNNKRIQIVNDKFILGNKKKEVFLLSNGVIRVPKSDGTYKREKLTDGLLFLLFEDNNEDIKNAKEKLKIITEDDFKKWIEILIRTGGINNANITDPTRTHEAVKAVNNVLKLFGYDTIDKVKQLLQDQGTEYQKGNGMPNTNLGEYNQWLNTNMPLIQKLLPDIQKGSAVASDQLIGILQTNPFVNVKQLQKIGRMQEPMKGGFLGNLLGNIPIVGPLIKGLFGSGQAGGSFLSGIPIVGPILGMFGLGQPVGRGLKAVDGGNHYVLGEVAIDKKELLIGHLVVRRGNEIIFQSKKVDPDLIELITKRFNPKKAYSAVAIDMWRKLHKLSGLPIVGSHSKKQNLIGSGLKVQFVDNPNQLLERLNILVGSWNAGNKNQEIYNEAIQIIDYLLNKGVINKTAHKKIFNQLK